MKKKLLHIALLCFGLYSFGQDCPDLISPVDGETDVPVDTSIAWENVDGVPAYRIRLGTTPGGIEIAEATTGTNTSYTPAFTLPENTIVYVTIILDFLFLSSDIVVCESQSFRTADVTEPPLCSQILNPQNGGNGLSIFSSINWTYAPTALGYYLSLGTTPGGTEILNNENVGNSFEYSPTDPFPENTTIYVTVIPYNENGSPTNCSSSSFTTGELPPLPNCTQLSSPLNGTSNVSLDTVLEWNEIDGADGYWLTVGSNPNSADIIDDLAVYNTETTVFDFEANRTYFVTVVPFNEAGRAIGCIEESFSTAIGCVYVDANNNQDVDLRPSVEFPEIFSFCGNNQSLTLNGPSGADGYRWYRTVNDNIESLLSESSIVEIQENGDYLLETYNIVTQFAENLECSTYHTFSVVDSEPPRIINFIERQTNFGVEITIEVDGSGDYEYAINDEIGPYQDSNVFNNVDGGINTYYVRDKNGCGIDSKRYGPNLILEGFPKFFTPNGDQNNDNWQFSLPPEAKLVEIISIRIFDRYGLFIQELDPKTNSWDGTLNGKPLPSGEFWFQATDENNEVYRGHFTLKR